MGELGGEIFHGTAGRRDSRVYRLFRARLFRHAPLVLLDLRINCTSHNSSMCLKARLTESQKQSALNFALDLLWHKCTSGAKPGIAATFEKDIANVQELINFGRSAKEIFLSTERAFKTASTQNVFLKELKSGARGVIGAPAGIGLRLSGNDGKIRGKFELEKSNLSVRELLGLNFIEALADENFKPLSPNELVNLIGALKPVFLDFKATLLVKKEAGGGFRNLNVKELRGI